MSKVTTEIEAEDWELPEGSSSMWRLLVFYIGAVWRNGEDKILTGGLEVLLGWYSACITCMKPKV